MRTLARETVFKYVFSKLFNDRDEGLLLALEKGAKLSEEDCVFAQSLANSVTDNIKEFDKRLEELSHSFSVKRMLACDKCALYIGMAELKDFDTPVAVAINEAVNLAAKYSTEKSTDFVNGILAKYADEVKNG